MMRLRQASRRPLPKRPFGRASIALSTRPAKSRALPGAARKKRLPAKVRLHQSGRPEMPKPPARQIPWWVFPEKDNERSAAAGTGPALGSGPMAEPEPTTNSPVPPSAPIAVWIIGGYAFPQASRAVYAPYYPGMTVRQALAATRLVAFGPSGGIVRVTGVPVGGRIHVRIQYNGRVIPMTLLDQPIAAGGTILAELYYI